MDKQPLWQSRGMLLALVALSALAGATALFGQQSAERRDAGAVNAASASITDPAITDPVGLAPSDLAELASIVDAETLFAPLHAGASTTPIIVSLAPSPTAESLGWRAGDHNTATPAGWAADLSDPLIRDQRQHEVASEHDWLLEQLATPGLEITEVFRYQFGIAGNATVEALEHLAQHPAVRQIEPDRRLDGTEPNAASPSATRPETATTVSALIADWEQAITQLNADSDASVRVLGIETAAPPFATPGHCDAQLPALATAAAHARAAGISLFAPAGDDGYCDRLAWPACLSGVHAIGAVYPDDQGLVEACLAEEACALPQQPAPERCADGGRRLLEVAVADQVPASSNADPTLSLLASTNRPPAAAAQPALTAEAALNAANAARTVQQSAQEQAGLWSTPSQLIDHLRQTGWRVVDPKTGLITPRLDLSAALADLDALIALAGDTRTDFSASAPVSDRSAGDTSSVQPTAGAERVTQTKPLASSDTRETRAACTDGDHLELRDQTLTGQATYQACQTITAGPLVLTSAADVTFEAGRSISLQPGFTVQQGAQLQARVRSDLTPGLSYPLNDTMPLPTTLRDAALSIQREHKVRDAL